MKLSKNARVEQLQEYFKGHNKSKEQKAHTSKVWKNHLIKAVVRCFFLQCLVWCLLFFKVMFC